MTVYKFRVLQTSWGIAIDVDGMLHDGMLPHAITVTEQVGFINSTTLNPMAVNDGIVEGIKMMTDQIRTKQSCTTVEITKLDFSLCDFQADGIRFAVAEWIAAEIGVPSPLYDVTFDPLERKYVFNS